MVSIYTHRNIAGLPPDVYFELKNASSVDITEDRGLIFVKGYGAAQWLEVVHAPLVYPGRMLLAITDTEVLLFPLERNQRIAPTPLVRSAATAYTERRRDMLNKALKGSTAAANPYLACLGLGAKKLPTTTGAAAPENNSSSLLHKVATKVTQKGPVLQFKLSNIGYLGLQFAVPSSVPFWDLSHRIYDYELPSWDRSAVSPGGGLGTSHADFIVEVQAVRAVPEIFGDARSNVASSSCPPPTQLRLVATEPRSALPGVLHRMWARAVVLDAAGLPTAQLAPSNASATSAASSFLRCALEALRQRDAEWPTLDDQCECLKEVECELMTDGGLKAAFWSDDLGLLRWCVDTLDRAEGLLDAAPTHAHRLRCFELFLRCLRVIAAALAHADTCLVPGLREGWPTVFQGALKPAPLTLETVVEVCSQDLAGSFDAVQYAASLRESTEDEQYMKTSSARGTPRRYSVSGSEELRFGQRTSFNSYNDDDGQSLSMASLAAVVDSAPSTPRAQAGNCDQGLLPGLRGGFRFAAATTRGRVNASKLRRRSHHNVQHDEKSAVHSHANFAASLAGGTGNRGHDHHEEIDWLEFGTPRSEHSSSNGMHHEALLSSSSRARANQNGDFSMAALASSGGAAVRLEADARMEKHPEEKALVNDLVDAQAFLLSHLHALAVHHAATLPREGEPTAVLDALLQPGSVQRGLTESFTARLADRVRCLGIDLCHMYPRQWMNQWLAAGCPCDDREPNDHDRTTTKNNHNGGGSASSAGSGNNGKRSNVDARDIDGSCSSKSRAAASTLSPSKQRKALQRCLAPWIAVGQTVEVRQQGLSKQVRWRHAVITSIATRAKPQSDGEGVTPPATNSPSSRTPPTHPASTTAAASRRKDRDENWGMGWGLRYTVKYLPEGNAPHKGQQQEKKLQHHQEQLQQRQEEEEEEECQQKREKLQHEVNAQEHEEDHLGRKEEDPGAAVTSLHEPSLATDATAEASKGFEKGTPAASETSRGAEESKEEIDVDKTNASPAAVDAPKDVDHPKVTNHKDASSDSDDDGVAQMWRHSSEMLVEAEIEFGVLPQRIRPLRATTQKALRMSPTRQRGDHGSTLYNKTHQETGPGERIVNATEVSGVAVDEDIDGAEDDVQDRCAALTAQFPGKPWFWWRSRQQSMVESVERPSSSHGWQHWGTNRRHAAAVPCPEFKGIEHNLNQKASAARRLNYTEPSHSDGYYGGENGTQGDNEDLTPRTRAVRNAISLDERSTKNAEVGVREEEDAAAAHEYVEVDYLCSGSGCPEVALHVIAGLLLSLLRHAPRGDIPLAHALLKFGAEEVKSGLCNVSTDIALRRAPNRAALRLNYRTAADLKAVAEIAHAALLESGLS